MLIGGAKPAGERGSVGWRAWILQCPMRRWLFKRQGRGGAAVWTPEWEVSCRVTSKGKRPLGPAGSRGRGSQGWGGSQKPAREPGARRTWRGGAEVGHGPTWRIDLIIQFNKLDSIHWTGSDALHLHNKVKNRFVKVELNLFQDLVATDLVNSSDLCNNIRLTKLSPQGSEALGIFCTHQLILLTSVLFFFPLGRWEGGQRKECIFSPR